MESCPNCGSKINQEDNFCTSCGSALQMDPGAETQGQEPAKDKDPTEEEMTTQENDDETNSDDKRQRWLEQQKAFQNELSGLKTDLKDEITIKPGPIDMPFPSPIQRYNFNQADFDIIGRNYNPFNIDLIGIKNTGGQIRASGNDNDPGKESHADEPNGSGDRNETGSAGYGQEQNDVESETEKKGDSGETTGGASNKTVTSNGITKRAIVKPKEISVNSDDILRVDSILNDSDNDVGQRNPSIAGAIDKIMTHEKGQKTKVMKMKLSTPSLKSPVTKKYEAEELINSIETAIRKTSPDFNSKPIRKILSNSKKKYAQSDFDAALDLAVSAKKALKRFQEYHETAKEKVKELGRNYPSIKDPDHVHFKDYQKLLLFMAEGQYHKASQKLPQLAEKLEKNLKNGPSANPMAEPVRRKVEQPIPASGKVSARGTSRGVGQKLGGRAIPAARAKAPGNQTEPDINIQVGTSKGAPETEQDQDQKMPKWMKNKGRRKKKRNR